MQLTYKQIIKVMREGGEWYLIKGDMLLRFKKLSELFNVLNNLI